MRRNYFDDNPGLTPEQRRQRLETVAYAKTSGNYEVPLSEEEIQDRHKDLSHNTIKVRAIQDEKKAVAVHFNNQLKPLAKLEAKLSREIIDRTRKEDGMLYNVINDENGRMMDVYTELGELLYSRPLLPNERQTSLLEPGMRVAS